MYRPTGAGRPVDGQRELLQRFRIQKFLGKGSFGSVYRVQRISDGQIYACKETDVRTMPQPDREEAVNEIRLLASVQHPNVVGYHEAFVDNHKLCIVMEFAPLGDMARIIKAAKDARKLLPEPEIWKYFIQIARGLACLHSMRILHRDIKPANIMVTDANTVKIGDLGIAKLMKNASMARTQIGTPHYMPPEIWKNQLYSFSTDAWALGCVLYELSALSVPFDARTMQELRSKVLKGTYPPISRQYSTDLSQMIAKLMDMNPRTRWTLKQVLRSNIVAKYAHLVPGIDEQVPAGGNPNAGMLRTIMVPRNLKLLDKALPPSNYVTDALPAAPSGLAAPAMLAPAAPMLAPAQLPQPMAPAAAVNIPPLALPQRPDPEPHRPQELNQPAGRRPSEWGPTNAHASPAPSVADGISRVSTPPIQDRPAPSAMPNRGPQPRAAAQQAPLSAEGRNPKQAAIQGLAAQQRAKAAAAAQERAAQYLEHYAHIGDRGRTDGYAQPAMPAGISPSVAHERDRDLAAAAAEQQAAAYLRQYENVLEAQAAQQAQQEQRMAQPPGAIAEYDMDAAHPAQQRRQADLAEKDYLRRKAVEQERAAAAAVALRPSPQAYPGAAYRAPVRQPQPSKSRQQTSNSAYGACYVPKGMSAQQQRALQRYQQQMAERERELQARLPASQWPVQAAHENNQCAAAANAQRMRDSHILPPILDRDQESPCSSYQAAFNGAPHLRAAIHGGGGARDLIYGGGGGDRGRPSATPSAAAYQPNINRVRLPPVACREAKAGPIGRLPVLQQDPLCLGRKPWA